MFNAVIVLMKFSIQLFFHVYQMDFHSCNSNGMWVESAFKPLLVTNNSFGSRTAAADNMGAATAAHVARSVRSRIDAVICR